MSSFLDEAKGLLTPELIGKAASAFGVPADGITKAMGAALPTVLGAVAGKAGDSGFMGQLFEMATHSSNSAAPGASAMSMIESMAGGGSSPLLDMGKKLVGGLFGGAMGDGVMGAIGKMAGVGGAGSGIMGTVAAMAISMIGNRVRTGGMNVGSLASTLMGEKDSLMKAIPGPIAGLMGLGDMMGAGAGAAKAAAGAATAGAGAALGAARGTAAAATSSGSKLLPALLGLAAVGAIGWYLMRGKAPEAPATPVATPPAAAAPAVAANGMQMMKLPNGTEIEASPTGIESQLVAFIQDAGKAVDKTTWFDFDRLLFETGSATLQPSSMAQLTNISEIMKAFPNVKLKVGGYTDNVGKAASNMKLSGDRANAAVAELVKMGVAADRLAGEGYGDKVPVAPNTTDEGRAKNRRTAARVTAK